MLHRLTFLLRSRGYALFARDSMGLTAHTRIGHGYFSGDSPQLSSLSVSPFRPTTYTPILKVCIPDQPVRSLRCIRNGPLTESSGTIGICGRMYIPAGELPTS